MSAHTDSSNYQFCCICQELQTKRTPPFIEQNAGLNNRIFAETDNFAALPSLSPLTAGHVLLVPNLHITSMAQIDKSLHREFNFFLRRLLTRLSKCFKPPLILEHGIAKGKSGGCGINHAHLHLLPLSPVVTAKVKSTVFQKFIFESTNMHQLLSGTDHHRSYLLFGLKPQQLSVSFRENVPSQYLRRIIANELGLPRWDWREKFGWEDIKRTYEVLVGF